MSQVALLKPAEGRVILASGLRASLQPLPLPVTVVLRERELLILAKQGQGA